MRLKILFVVLALFSIHLINSVNAQLDIQTIKPTLEPTQTTDIQSKPAPDSAQPVIRRPPSKCVVDQNSLLDPVRVGDLIIGHLGEGTDPVTDVKLWYVFKAGGGNLTAEDLTENILKNLNKEGGVQRGLAEILASIPPDGTACIFTGISPTIFIYSSNTQVLPLAPILYQEVNKEYYYYEYDSTNISFNKPKEGWIVEKNHLKRFVESISNSLKLLPLEKERLFFELNFSASDINSDKLFIGLIPQQEIDEKLPLKIESLNNPKVIRYHFYVSPAKKDIVKPLNLKKFKELSR